MSKYKECLPQETIQNILNILKRLSLDVKIFEYQNSDNTYSCHVELYFKDKKIGNSNGKGKNRDYALASGLSESMERLSNDALIIPSLSYLDDIDFQKENFKEFGYKIHHEEKELTFKEYSNQNLYKDLVNIYGKYMECAFLNRNTSICVPFKNILTNEVNYLSNNWFGIDYILGTNGMVAGNSFKEAMIEGISELFERVSIRKVCLNEFATPNIPLSILKDYPELYKIVIDLEENNFSVQLKDFSCGGKYPAIGLVLTDKNTGNYHVNIGANPVFHIAVERCFTEIFQNQNLDSIRNNFIEHTAYEILDKAKNLARLYLDGYAHYPNTVILQNNDQAFLNHFIFDKNELKSIDEVYNYMLKLIKDNNINCWVKNSSYYGFNAYHILFSNECTSISSFSKEHSEKVAEKISDFMNNDVLIAKKMLYEKDLDLSKLYEIALRIINNNRLILINYYPCDSKSNDLNILATLLFFVFFLNKDYHNALYIFSSIDLNTILNSKINEYLIYCFIYARFKHKSISLDTAVNMFRNTKKSFYEFEDIVNNHKEDLMFLINIDNYVENDIEIYKDFFKHLHKFEKHF